MNNNIFESQLVELLSYLRFILFDGDINVLYNYMSNNNNNENYDYEDITFSFYYIYPISKELEIEVLNHLLLLLKNALNNYPTTDDEDKQMLKKKNISFNYRNCLLLLMSKKEVLNYYIYFCEYCLSLFNLNNEMNIISKVSNDFQLNDCQFEFYIQEVIIKLTKMSNNDNNNNDIVNVNDNDNIIVIIIKNFF